jgi:Protein of unknown function (DUF4038)
MNYGMGWMRQLNNTREEIARLWMMLVGALLIVATLAVVHHQRPQRQTIPRFQIPAADRVAKNSAGSTAETVARSRQLMTLDPTRKFLINSDTNKPVFITGEAVWSLDVQLSDADKQYCPADRQARDFNAIWVGLADNTYSNHPPKDFYGNVPFNGADFTNENPANWKRVDQTLAWAAARGISVFASPAFARLRLESTGEAWDRRLCRLCVP